MRGRSYARLMYRRKWHLGGIGATVLATACVAAADARPSSDPGAPPEVAGSVYCGSIANPCPDEWYLLLDGTTIVMRDIPAAPFSGGAPPVVGRDRPIEA